MRSLRKEFGSLLEAGKDLLFPVKCFSCRQLLSRRNSALLCSSCLPKIPYNAKPYCQCCGFPFGTGADHLCGNCLTGSFEFARARAAVLYKEMIPEMIKSFKYQGNMNFLATMGFLAVNSIGFGELSSPDLIIPVPLHKKKLQQRGFNQALLLARVCFSQRSQQIAAEVLIRNRFTKAQSKLSGDERRLNVKDAFTVRRPDQIFGKNILLVDDVFTTGTTVNECARQLNSAGASRVEIFTLARGV